MLKTPSVFPFVGSTCYFDDQSADGQDVVEKARVQRDNGDGTALISIESARFPGEVASGNRTVAFAQLRETEQPAALLAKMEDRPAPRRRRAGR